MKSFLWGGNISLKDGNPFMHLHGTFSDKDFNVVGGHFFHGIISVTGEFFISKMGNLEIQRKHNPETGIWEIDC